MSNPVIRERSIEAKTAYHQGYMAGMEQAARIAGNEGYSSVAAAIKAFADDAANFLKAMEKETPK